MIGKFIHRRAAAVVREACALLRDRIGGALVVVAVLLPAVIGFAGLGVDLTHWYSERRAMQNMADGAAIAATHAVMAGANDAAVRAAAEEGAARNGWNVAEGYPLQVFAPPDGGMYPGLHRAAAVRVGRPVPLYFLAALGSPPVHSTPPPTR